MEEKNSKKKNLKIVIFVIISKYYLLVLPHGDKNVEKIHCKILTDKGFAYSNTLTKPLLLFFSLFRN